jgi:hypothetical protein
MHIDTSPSSAGFRHIKRSLNAGEAVPRFPSLFEQLTACTRGPVVIDEAEGDQALAEIEDEE